MPTEHFKIYDSALVVVSVFGEYGQRPVQFGQAIDPQNLPLSGHPLVQKARAGMARGPPE